MKLIDYFTYMIIIINLGLLFLFLIPFISFIWLNVIIGEINIINRLSN